MSMGEYSCNSQTTTEGSESTNLVALNFFIARFAIDLRTTERESPVNVEKCSHFSKWIMM